MTSHDSLLGWKRLHSRERGKRRVLLNYSGWRVYQHTKNGDAPIVLRGKEITMARIGVRSLALLLLALLLAGAIFLKLRDRSYNEQEDVFVNDVEQIATKLRTAFPKHFLADAVIAQSDYIDRPMAFGEPDPPEGFAGPDPTGRHPFGIYVPIDRDEYFKDDISLGQWILHEMFHLHNRRTKEYDPYIDKAFPDDSDPLVQWLMKDPYHRTFAREEAFINLISFADPARTEAQNEAVREWFDYIGARDKSLEEIREILNVIEHW